MHPKNYPNYDIYQLWKSKFSILTNFEVPQLLNFLTIEIWMCPWYQLEQEVPNWNILKQCVALPNTTTMSDYFMNRKSGNGLVAPWRAFSQPLGQIFDLCSWPQSKVSLRAQSMQYTAITKLENCCNCSKSKILGPRAIFTLLRMVSKLGEDNIMNIEKISRNVP